MTLPLRLPLFFCCLAITAMTLSSSLLAEDSGPAKNSRIVFLGDSITQQGAGPKGYVTLVRKAFDELHPERNIEIVGAGISGNRVPDLEKRLDKDVIAKEPTTVVVYIGINDVWHSDRGRGTSKEDFRAGLNRIVDRIHQADAEVILCTPSVIGEKSDGSNRLDSMLEEYSAITREVAKTQKVKLFDLRKAFIAELERTNKQQKDDGLLTYDGVHLSEKGNEFVAEHMVNWLNNANDEQAEDNHKGEVLRHVVLFRFKEDATAEQIKRVEDAFAALPKKIDVIKDFEMGTDVGIEGLSDGFTHAFVVTFENEAGRATYLPHPAHKEFVTILKPILDKVIVIDFWTPAK